MSTEQQALWDQHREAWSHCMRCPLAARRLSTDARSHKGPQQVPMPRTLRGDAPEGRVCVVLLLSTPDSLQEIAGDLTRAITHNRTKIVSPQLLTFRHVWDFMWKDWSIPVEPEEVALVVAQGCRPVDFSDTRKTLLPTQAMIRPCQPRWQDEVYLLDPSLVVACGHFAYSHIHPQESKRGAFSRRLGEVLTLEIPGPGGVMVQYPALIAPDPQEVVRYSRNEHWDIPMEAAPPRSASQDPLQALAWALYRGLWMGWLLRYTAAEGGLPHPLPEALGAIQRGLTAVHRESTRVGDAAARLKVWCQTVAAQELSPEDVRTLQQDTQTPAYRISRKPSMSVQRLHQQAAEQGADDDASDDASEDVAEPTEELEEEPS